MSTILEYLATFGAGFVLTAALIPTTKRVALKFKIVSFPSADRWHGQPTPITGGLAILLGFMLVCLVTRTIDLALAIGAMTMFLVGFVDDIVTLTAPRKFLLQVAGVGLVLAVAPPIRILDVRALDLALTAFWLLAVANAFNFTDGVDGLAGGIGVISSLGLAAIFALHGAPFSEIVLPLALAGALGGFLLSNLSPASIFMGDEGALFVGLVIGYVSLLAGHSADSGPGERSLVSRLAIPILTMMVPLIDLATVSVTRVANGSTVATRGLDHPHHRLARLGLSDRRVTYVLYAVQVIALLSAIAFSLIPNYASILATPFVGLLFVLLCLFLMDRSFVDSFDGSLERGWRIAQLILNIGYKRRVVEVGLDAALIAAAFFGAHLLRLDFRATPQLVEALLRSLLVVVPLAYVELFAFGVYRGIWRSTGLEDAVRIAGASLSAAASLFLVSGYISSSPTKSIDLLFGVLLFNGLMAARVSFRLFRAAARALSSGGRVLVVGAGGVAEAAVHHLLRIDSDKKRIIGFVDDDPFKLGKRIKGSRVLGSIRQIDEIFDTTPFDEIVLAGEFLTPSRIQELERFASSRGLGMVRFSLRISELKSSLDNDAGRSGASSTNDKMRAVMRATKHIPAS